VNGRKVRSDMLHGSETWPVKKDNKTALHCAWARVTGRMHAVKLNDKLSRV